MANRSERAARSERALRPDEERRRTRIEEDF